MVLLASQMPATSDGGSVDGESTQSVPAGGDGSAVTAAPDIGHHFIGWSDGVQTATRADTT